jgi:hypothetical protein
MGRPLCTVASVSRFAKMIGGRQCQRHIDPNVQHLLPEYLKAAHLTLAYLVHSDWQSLAVTSFGATCGKRYSMAPVRHLHCAVYSPPQLFQNPLPLQLVTVSLPLPIGPKPGAYVPGIST